MEVKISGAMLKCFAQACINLKYLLGGEVSNICDRVNVTLWYPLSEYIKICNLISNTYKNPDPVLERAGVEMMNIWYFNGPGKTVVTGGVEFLKYQTGSKGYYSVVKGSPKVIGSFSLTKLDTVIGSAVITSTTPLNRSIEKGVLLGGGCPFLMNSIILMWKFMRVLMFFSWNFIDG